MAECDSPLPQTHKRTKMWRKRCELLSWRKGGQLHRGFKGWDKSLSSESICSRMSWRRVRRGKSLLYDWKVDVKLLSFGLPWSISSPVWLILADIFDCLKWGFFVIELGMPNGTYGKHPIVSIYQDFFLPIVGRACYFNRSKDVIIEGLTNLKNMTVCWFLVSITFVINTMPNNFLSPQAVSLTRQSSGLMNGLKLGGESKIG